MLVNAGISRVYVAKKSAATAISKKEIGSKLGSSLLLAEAARFQHGVNSNDNENMSLVTHCEVVRQRKRGARQHCYLRWLERLASVGESGYTYVIPKV